MKKTSLLVGVAILSSITISLSAQAPPQIETGSQPAVAALRTLAQTIKECPKDMTSETRWGKKENEIYRQFVGPPQNVIWDVLSSKSIRSPYTGYIEFTLPEERWLPDDVKDKFYESSPNRLLAELIVRKQGSLRHRYEFDLGPDGLTLTKMLEQRSSMKTEWMDLRPSGTACWEKAARTVQVMTESSSANPGLAGDRLGTVEWLVKSCEDSTGPGQLSCYPFFAGLNLAGRIASVSIKRNFIEVKEGEPFFCLPDDITSTDKLIKAFVEWAKGHPERNNEESTLGAWEILRDAFPCPKQIQSINKQGVP